jgi:hypothetical protein
MLTCCLAILSSGACRREPVSALAPCVDVVELQVVRDEPGPTFTWAPECTVETLNVQGDRGGYWQISGQEFGPPVVYGRTPPGVLTSGLVPLERGRTYLVQIGRGWSGFGTASFVW